MQYDSTDEQFEYPDVRTKLQKKLIDEYVPPVLFPDEPDIPRALDETELLTLKHYTAWKESNGTVLGYKLHAKVLEEATGHKILSLYSARKLAVQLAGLDIIRVDMCPRSCIAYVGEFEAIDKCPHIRTDGKVCGEARYKQGSTSRKRVPRAQMMYIPVVPHIKARFVNKESAQMMHHRDKCLQETLKIVANARTSKFRTYSDFADSDAHIHQYQKMKLFQRKTDVALALSSDGAQLSMKKQSDTWVVALQVLNLPPDIRTHSNEIIIPMAVPGPNPLGNADSF
ncbi:hypothetical protein FA95DRAFT_1504307, partial [Auriscalpium vulgare]